MKYKKRSESIFDDFEHYVSKENLFQIAFFGYKSSKHINKLNYIWKTLLKQHKRV